MNKQFEGHGTIEAAVEWASGVSDTPFVILSSRPWSCVVRVQGHCNDSILKVYNPKSRSCVPMFDTIALECPGAAPRVLKQDTTRGFALFEDHKGVDLCTIPDATRHHAAGILRTYGGIQRTLAGRTDLIDKLRPHNPIEALDRCIALAQSAASGSSTGSSPGNPYAYMKQGAAQGHADFLRAARPFLIELFAPGYQVPWTVNHCDLNTSNVAVRADGSYCLLDWDSALNGPPGWSLHHLFDGAFRVWRACNAPRATASAQDAHDQEALNAYITQLTVTDTYDDAAIRRALPGSAVAGVLDYIVEMSGFHIDAISEQRGIQSFVTRRIKDLAKVVYAVAGPTRRISPDLASAFGSIGHTDLSDTAYRQLMRQNKGQSSIRIALQDGPGVFPRVTAAEATDDTAHCVNLFERHGALLIEGAVAADVVQAANSAIEAHASRFEADIRAGKALAVGAKRQMFSVPLQGAFANLDLLRPASVMRVLSHVLGTDLILGSATAVIAQPGAKKQHMHRDNPALFDDAMQALGKSFAITVMVPLIALTAQNGPTEIMKGSHLCPDARIPNFATQACDVPVGSVYMMDSRLYHAGMANRSRHSRPVLSLVYQKPWYTDPVNFRSQDRLLIGKDLLATATAVDRRLFEWALDRDRT